MPFKIARQGEKSKKGIIIAVAFLSLTLFFLPLSSFGAMEEEYVDWVIPTDEYKPALPINLNYTYDNFWINYTWSPGSTVGGYSITDSYNNSYLVNAVPYWDNSTNTSLNRTVGPHGWLNISQLWAYNDSYANLSDGYIYQNAQVPNNPITITNTSDWIGNESELVYLDFNYTDLDGDAGTFVTNATKGALNSTTGIFEWQTTLADDGIYHWYFNVSDGYGSSSVYVSNVTVLDLGDIINLTGWYNNYTSDNSTSFTIPYEDADNRTVFFNVTAEQEMDYWMWYVDGALYQNSSSNNITNMWDDGGDKTVSVYGVNLNGQTPTLTWYIEIEHTIYEYQKLIYAQNQLLMEETEMLGQTWLFVALLVIAFVALAIGYLSPNATFKMFGAAFSAIMFIILSYAILGNQFGEMLQMAWLATLMAALGLIQAIYTVLMAIGILYLMFTSKRHAGMDAIPYDSGDRNW